MKILLVVFTLSAIANFSHSQVRVKYFVKKNGTYVEPHARTRPDKKLYNNYAYPGNTNPYTGKTKPLKIIRKSTY